jgi:hypothetical protein
MKCPRTDFVKEKRVDVSDTRERPLSCVKFEVFTAVVMGSGAGIA